MILKSIGIYVIVSTALGMLLAVRSWNLRISSNAPRSAWPDGRPVLDYIQGPYLSNESRNWNLNSGTCPMLDVLVGEYGMVSVLLEGNLIHQETLLESPFAAIRDFESAGVEDE